MATHAAALPRWTVAAPAAALLALLLPGASGGVAALAMAVALVGGVLAAVHHAEVVAHRVGEPFGTLILAIAVTIIEASLIVSLMMAGGPATSALARDTVFAAVMIILNGIVGLCLLWGGSRHHEQRFSLEGAATALATLAAIVVLTLVLPNYTTTMAGPVYSRSQLVFIAILSIILYGAFVFVQTVRHRDYFLPQHGASSEADHAPPPATRTALTSLVLLGVCLGAVVLLAKALSPMLEAAVATAGAPAALVGVIIAAVVLLPEGLAALRAARADRLQTSLNLALGSALATIGLTIPVVAVTSIALGFPLTLGIDGRSSALLLLSLFVTSLSLSTGRTTVLQGVILLVLFAVYLFTTIVP